MPKVINNAENGKHCICPKCPSYNVCGKEKNELLFCAAPKAARKCAYNENGCICDGCEVYKNNKLTKGYYCRKGSAEEYESM
jgi:hypothetical protein